MTATEEREERIRSLELALEEQRRDHEVFARLYEEAKTKNFTFLAAALALLGFLYGVTPDTAHTLAEKLFIPKEPYGVIIYFLSLAAFLGSIGALLFALKPLPWSTSYDNDQEEDLIKDYEGYLQYMKKCYLRASHINIKSYSKKQIMLNMSFIPLLVGGILLLLLKTFGG
ncbi:MAG: hypothetical protein JWL85_519 [Candidatus Saccharibacteria bacterium]|nr:hypothetical protein [Candidatus Saccharibacteria bacterium]